MIINHNLASLNAWRNLQNTDQQLNTSLERLSSGLRINRAADDAAGLAISEKMRAQINGLTQAISNAQNGISLLQTAEGALGTSESILQRMRQLSMSSAADSASASDRQQNQKEMDQLAQEMSRISNTTEFNTKNLLGGAFQNQSFQIGANANQNVQFSIGAMDAASLGVTAKQGVTVADGNLVTSAYLGTGATATTQAYQVTGTAVAGTADTATATQATAAASYKISLTGGTTGATDTVTVNMATGSAGNGYTFNVVAGTSAGAVTASLSGKVVTVNLSTTAGTNTAANVTAAVTGALGALATSVTAGAGAGSGATGSTNTTLTTGLDAASIQFNATNAGANSGLKVVLAAGSPTSGNASAAYNSAAQTVTVTYNASAQISDILNAVNNNSSVSSVMTASSSSAPTGPWGTALASTSLAGGTNASLTLNLLDSNGATVQSGVAVTGGTASFSNVGLNVAVSQTVANTLASGNITAQTIDVVTANSMAAVAGTNGVLNGQATVSKGILIDTQTNASAALTAIDAAINKVSTARATLGALQNRLNNTVSNLGTTSDNMSAAESRVRDADMAQEMSNFTRRQILMQAGTAMLAQANQMPQSVLQLLK